MRDEDLFTPEEREYIDEEAWAQATASKRAGEAAANPNNDVDVSLRLALERADTVAEWALHKASTMDMKPFDPSASSASSTVGGDTKFGQLMTRLHRATTVAVGEKQQRPSSGDDSTGDNSSGGNTGDMNGVNNTPGTLLTDAAALAGCMKTGKSEAECTALLTTCKALTDPNELQACLQLMGSAHVAAVDREKTAALGEALKAKSSSIDALDTFSDTDGNHENNWRRGPGTKHWRQSHDESGREIKQTTGSKTVSKTVSKTTDKTVVLLEVGEDGKRRAASLSPPLGDKKHQARSHIHATPAADKFALLTDVVQATQAVLQYMMAKPPSSSTSGGAAKKPRSPAPPTGDVDDHLHYWPRRGSIEGGTQVVVEGKLLRVLGNSLGSTHGHANGPGKYVEEYILNSVWRNIYTDK